MSRHVTERRAQVHDISKARILQGLNALHRPYNVYEECRHSHALNDPLAQQIEGLGMVCDEGIVAVICEHCCTEPEYGQREICATEHKHLPAYAICPTMAIVEGRDAPWRP